VSGTGLTKSVGFDAFLKDKRQLIISAIEEGKMDFSFPFTHSIT
jgi:hypothetical protein